MASSEKDEAITVVIEKLTEIVGEIDHVSEESDEKEAIEDIKSSLTGDSEASSSSQSDTQKQPTKVQPKVITNKNGERTLILTTTKDSSDDETARQVVLNFPVKVGNLNIENPEELIQTLRNLNCALEPGKTVPQKCASTSSQVKKETFKCAKCDYSSHNKHYLKQHVELVHNAERPFKCPFCDYAGKRSHSLKEHLVVHSSYRPYECSLCNATFRKKGHLTNHVRMHTTKKTQGCSLCKQTFSEQLQLYHHLRKDHSENDIYPCDVCDYATTDKNNIVMHMHAHGNPKNFVCQSCNFVAVHSKIMVEHIQADHDGDGAYAIEPNNKAKSGPVILLKCSECGFTSDNRTTLAAHMWEHIPHESGQDESEQGQASTSTKQPGGTHSADHQDTTPSTSTARQAKDLAPTVYHCAQCNYSSPEAYVFITHMLSHKPNVPKANITPDPPAASGAGKTAEAAQSKPFVHDAWAGVYRCSICSYTCELQRTIKAHIWKHIGTNDIDYPMFQNGPLSVYDDTPIGVPMLLGGKAPVATISSPSAPVPVAFKDDPPRVAIKEFMDTGTADEVPPVGMTISVGDSPVALTNHLKSAIATTAAKLETTRTAPPTKGKSLVVRRDIEPVGKKLQLTQNATVIMKPAPKRKPPTQDTDLKAAVKKLRSHKETTENVVVQEVSKVYTTPTFSMITRSSLLQNSSGAPSPESTVSASSSPSALNVSNETLSVVAEIPADQTQAEVPVPQDNIELDMQIEEARVDAPLPEHCVEVEITADSTPLVQAQTVMITQQGGEETERIMTYSTSDIEAAVEGDDGRDGDSDGSQKTGICKSLLAVIEQLRERSKSESEDDAGGTARGKGKRRKSAPGDIVVTTDPDVPLDTNLNVEKVDGQFRCKLCHYSSPASGLMTTHMRLHKAKKPSECSLCNYTAESSEDLQDHVLQHCKVRTYQCKLCSSSFSYKSQLRAHMRAHNERAPFSCIHCPFQTIDPVVFTNHGKQHLQTIHMCTTCGQKYDTKSELDRHTQAKCRGKEVLKCDECDFTSINKESYRKHMRWHGKAYKCDKCEFSSTNYTEFKSHGRTHEEEQELKCDLCDFIASSTRSLKSHMKRHVNDQRFVQQPLEQYKCNMCGYVCHHLPSLKSHMWRHASDASYSYENTNEVINAAIDYDSRTEEEKKNKVNPKSPDCLVTFRCCQCGFETVEKSKLNQHMKSHMDIIKKTLEVNKGRVGNLLAGQPSSAEGDAVTAEETLRATESVEVTESGDANASEMSQ